MYTEFKSILITGVDSCGRGQGLVTGYCEQSNDYWGRTKGRGLLAHLSDSVPYRSRTKISEAHFVKQC